MKDALIVGAIDALILSVAVLIFLKRRGTYHASPSKTSRLRSAGLFVSLVTGICLLIGVGGQLQQRFVALVSSSEANLYETVTPNGLVWFEDLATWIIESVNWPMFLIACCVILVSVEARKTRILFVHAATTGAVGLFLVDVLGGLVTHQKFPYYAENALADLAGGLVVGALVVALFRLIDLILVRSNAGRVPANLAAVACPIAVGAALNLATYYIFLALYNPTSTHVELSATPPLSMIYWPPDQRLSRDGKVKPFGVFTEPSSSRQSFVISYVESPLMADWKSFDGRPAKIDVSFFANCRAEDLKKLAKAGKLHTGSYDANTFSVSVERGQGEFVGNLLQEGGSYFYVASKDKATQAWLQKNNGKYKVSRFLHDPATAHYWSADSELVASLGQYLMDGRRGGPVGIVPRTFKIRAGQSTQTLRFTPPSAPSKYLSRYCRTFVVPPDRSGPVLLSKGELSVGVLVRIEPQRHSDVFYLDERSALEVTASGWVSVAGIEKEVARGLVSTGFSGGLLLDQGATKLAEDGREIAVSSADRIFLMRGDTFLSVDEELKIAAEGDVGVLFRNQARLIQTRWERLDIAVQLAIATLLITIIGSFVTFLWGAVSADNDISWTVN